jgi:hypothetical protein
MLIEAWALVGEDESILVTTTNESIADTWRANGGRVERLSDAIKRPRGKDAAGQGDCGMDSYYVSSITPVVLESKPTDGADKLTISAYEAKVNNNRHGVKVELTDADVGDILEQIGFDRIFDYWSLAMVRREVERYARQHPEDEPPMAS